MHPNVGDPCTVDEMNKTIAAHNVDDECDRLLLLVAGGDQRALKNLFEREAGRLVAVAQRIVRRRELAEEVVQEAFVSVWRNASRFEPARGRARAWLSTIVRNRSLNVLRDSARLELASPEQMTEFQDRGGDADLAFESLADGNALRKCLAQLEPNRRRSVLLSYVLGYSHGEIASELAVPVGTVKAWIRRSVVSLQECLS